MAYADNEQSQQQSDNAELFTFNRAGYRKYYTSYYRNIERDGVTYVAAPIERGDISNEFGPEEMVCDVRGGLSDVFAMFTDTTPVVQVTLLIRKLFISVDEVNTIFEGRLIDYSMTLDGTASATFRTELFSKLDEVIPKVLWSTACNHVLFDARCALQRTTYEVRARITEVGTNTQGLPYVVVENSAPDGTGEGVQDKVTDYYADGVLRVDTHYRTVTACVDNDGAGRKKITLQYSVPGGKLAVEKLVRLVPGCNKSHDQCSARFSNTSHFGGFSRVQCATGPAVALGLKETDPVPIPVFYGQCWTRLLLYAYAHVFTTQLSYNYHWLVGHGTLDFLDAYGVNLKFPEGNTNRYGQPYPVGTETIEDYFWMSYNGSEGWPWLVRYSGTYIFQCFSEYITVNKVPFNLHGIAWAFMAETALALTPGSENATYTSHRIQPPWGFREWVAERNAIPDDNRYIMAKVRRLPVTPWPTYDVYDVHHVNAVTIVYDILTDPFWGCGIPVASIDVDSFTVAAARCYALRYCGDMALNVQRPAREYLQDIMRMADLTLSYGGDFRIRISQGSDDAGLTPVATILDGDVIDMKVTGQMWDATTNRYVVQHCFPTAEGWHINPRLKPPEIKIVLTNEANVQLTESIRTKTVELEKYFHVHPDGRNLCLYSMLRNDSFPRATVRMTVDLRQYQITAGDCVRISSVRFGFDSLFRVTNRTLSGADQNSITITAQQISEAIRSTDYVTLPDAVTPTPYDDHYGDNVALEENLTVVAYANNATGVRNDWAEDTSLIRVSWGDHPVLEGDLVTSQQSPVNYQCEVSFEDGAVHVILNTALDNIRDAVESNATGQLPLRVWELVS